MRSLMNRKGGSTQIKNNKPMIPVNSRGIHQEAETAGI